MVSSTSVDLILTPVHIHDGHRWALGGGLPFHLSSEKVPPYPCAIYDLISPSFVYYFFIAYFSVYYSGSLDIEPVPAS